MSSRDLTKTQILDATWRRLSVPGDDARLEDIARDVGKTRQTVYLCFGSRAALLTELVAHIDRSLGLGARIGEIDALEDPIDALLQSLSLTARYQGQIHGVAMALARLAPTDPDAAAAFEDRMRLRRAGLTRAVRAIKKAGVLGPGFKVRQVADALWQVGSPWAYQQLVIERGWSVPELERWLWHVARSFLCDQR